jgi:hypothetical protein
MKKLVQSLVSKLNDSKELVRNEVEIMLIEIQTHMPTKEMVLYILGCFEQQNIGDLGKR